MSKFREQATRGFVWNYVYKMTEFGIVNLYTILVVRHFGPSVSAPYSIFTAIGTTLAIFSSFATDGVLLRYIQRVKNNTEYRATHIADIERFNIRDFLTTLFTFRIIVLFLVSTIIVLIFLVAPFAANIPPRYLLYILCYLFTQSIVGFCTVSLIGLLETKSVFIASFIARGILILTGIIFVINDWLQLDEAIVLFIVSALLNAVILFYNMRKELDKHDVSGEKSQLHFRSIVRNLNHFFTTRGQLRLFLATPVMVYGITTWGSDLLSGVLGKQPDILMMGAILGEHSPQIGFYSSASIVLLVTEYIFLMGLGGTLVSIFSKLAHDDEKDIPFKNYSRLSHARLEIAGFQNVVLLPVCAFMMFFAPEVVRFAYGNKFDDAIPLIRIGLVALAISVGIFNGGMQVTSLVAIGKPKIVFRNRLFWGTANLISNYFLIHSYGAMGAIIGTQFCNAFACGAEGFFAARHIGSSFDLFGTSRITVISLIGASAGFFVVRMLNSELDFLRVVSGGLICGVIIVLLYAVFRVPEATAVWKRIQSFLRIPSSSYFAHD